jgi:hypothetical protein
MSTHVPAGEHGKQPSGHSLLDLSRVVCSVISAESNDSFKNRLLWAESEFAHVVCETDMPRPFDLIQLWARDQSKEKLMRLFLKLYRLCHRTVEDLNQYDNPFFANEEEERRVRPRREASWSSSSESSKTGEATTSIASETATAGYAERTGNGGTMPVVSITATDITIDAEERRAASGGKLTSPRVNSICADSVRRASVVDSPLASLLSFETRDPPPLDHKQTQPVELTFLSTTDRSTLFGTSPAFHGGDGLPITRQPSVKEATVVFPIPIAALDAPSIRAAAACNGSQPLLPRPITLWPLLPGDENSLVPPGAFRGLRIHATCQLEPVAASPSHTGTALTRVDSHSSPLSIPEERVVFVPVVSLHAVLDEPFRFSSAATAAESERLAADVNRPLADRINRQTLVRWQVAYGGIY